MQHPKVTNPIFTLQRASPPGGTATNRPQRSRVFTPAARRTVNRPGFGRDSLLGSGDQADQVAVLIQVLELYRRPTTARSMQPASVVPLHPHSSSDIDLAPI